MYQNKHLMKNISKTAVSSRIGRLLIGLVVLDVGALERDPLPARASLNLTNWLVLSEEVEAQQIDNWKYCNNCDRKHIMGGYWTSCSSHRDTHSKNFRRWRVGFLRGLFLVIARRARSFNCWNIFNILARFRSQHNWILYSRCRQHRNNSCGRNGNARA